MKVLAYIRADYKTNIGGDSIQFIKTIQHLENKGINITISNNPNEDLRPYDIIHIFNLIRIRDTYNYYKNSKAFKKKIILTPIYWNYGMYLYKNLKNQKYKINWCIDNALRKKVIQNVNLILLSSKAELNIIEKDFGVKKPYKIIYNGVDPKLMEGNPKEFFDKYKINEEEFVLSVGRICPHKNQLTLAKVCKDIGIPLVIIGPINDIKYFNTCKSANPLLIHIDKLEQDKLASAYSAAKVHSLVSWYETPGLVNLEAGIAGCNILTTSEGSTNEYFKDYAEYSLWNDEYNMSKKIVTLLNRQKNDEFKNYIIKNYLWQNTINSIIDAYKELLNSKI